jgi:hypothetical protein
MEALSLMDTAPDGTTTLITRSHLRLVLSPEASADLCRHLLQAFGATLRLAPTAVWHVSVGLPSAGQAFGRREAAALSGPACDCGAADMDDLHHATCAIFNPVGGA